MVAGKFMVNDWSTVTYCLDNGCLRAGEWLSGWWSSWPQTAHMAPVAPDRDHEIDSRIGQHMHPIAASDC